MKIRTYADTAGVWYLVTHTFKIADSSRGLSAIAELLVHLLRGHTYRHTDECRRKRYSASHAGIVNMSLGANSVNVTNECSGAIDVICHITKYELPYANTAGCTILSHKPGLSFIKRQNTCRLMTGVDCYEVIETDGDSCPKPSCRGSGVAANTVQVHRTFQCECC